MNLLEFAMYAGQFLGAIWDFISGVTLPILGIKASSFMIGIFLARFSLVLLGKTIGAGANMSHDDTGRTADFFGHSRKD